MIPNQENFVNLKGLILINKKVEKKTFFFSDPAGCFKHGGTAVEAACERQ